MVSAFAEREEATRGGVPDKVVRAVPPLSDDLHEAMGQLLAETIRQGRRTDEFGTKLDAAISEFRKASEQMRAERPELVHAASSKAATHTGNRLTVLLGALAILYTEAAPALHELWRMFHK